MSVEFAHVELCHCPPPTGCSTVGAGQVVAKRQTFMHTKAGKWLIQRLRDCCFMDVSSYEPGSWEFGGGGALLN